MNVVGHLFAELPWVFEFGVKFYAPEPSQLTEDITRFVFVLWHYLMFCMMQSSRLNVLQSLWHDKWEFLFKSQASH